MSETVIRVPAVDGWFTTDDGAPHLIGGKCTVCGTIVFPPREGACPNPDCDSDARTPFATCPSTTMPSSASSTAASA